MTEISFNIDRQMNLSMGENKFKGNFSKADAGKFKDTIENIINSKNNRIENKTSEAKESKEEITEDEKANLLLNNLAFMLPKEIDLENLDQIDLDFKALEEISLDGKIGRDLLDFFNLEENEELKEFIDLEELESLEGLDLLDLINPEEVESLDGKEVILDLVKDFEKEEVDVKEDKDLDIKNISRNKEDKLDKLNVEPKVIEDENIDSREAEIEEDSVKEEVFTVESKSEIKDEKIEKNFSLDIENTSKAPIENKVEIEEVIIEQDLFENNNLDLIENTLVEFIETAKDGDLERIRVQLKPKELGSMEIELIMDGANLEARFLVGNEHAQGLFENSLDQLNQNLLNQNIVLSEVQIDLGSENLDEGRRDRRFEDHKSNNKRNIEGILSSGMNRRYEKVYNAEGLNILA